MAVTLLVDTDMGSDCDDVGALFVLHALAQKAKILGCIYSSGKNPYGIGCVAAINAWCGHSDIPLGALHDRGFGDGRNPFSEAIARDTDAYGHSIISNDQVLDAVTTYRRLLVDQPDHSIVLASIGHLKALHEFYHSPADDIFHGTGLELASRKIRQWVCMGGRFPNSGTEPEWNFSANESASFTRQAIDVFPNEIVFIGWELGAEIITGRPFGSLPKLHPARRSYELFLGDHGLKKGRPSWDLATIHYAVSGEESVWKRIGPGRCSIDSKGNNTWKEDKTGRHFYLEARLPYEEIARILDDLILTTESPVLT
jgi:hypothetical protein